MKRALLLLPAIVLATVLFPAGAGAASSAPPAAKGKLTVNVEITKFRATAAKTTASGVATARLTDYAGKSSVIKQPIKLAVTRGGSCQILSLVLDELDLKLLGLNVHLDKVVLKVTGKRRGGTLGALFCKLAGSKLARAQAARELTAAAKKKPIRPIGFTVPLKGVVAAQSPAPTCQVLDLVLGPLNLDLLGLVVDLNKVKLAITATPGGGALGDLFCSLSK